MTTKEKILSSLKPVIDKPEFVTINDNRIAAIAHELLNAPVPAWDNNLQLLGTPEETAQYYFFLDSVNFCFWAEKGKKRWEYLVDGEWVGGYYAYSRAIKDAFLRDRRFFDAVYLREISLEDFGAIFKNGRHALLLVQERAEIIRENFGMLGDHFGGQAINLLKKADYDADAIVALLCKWFSTFEDHSLIERHRAYFLKRAQIFCSDISFTGLPELAIKNLDHLTVFADYKLPQILESFGVLSYAPKLNEDIIEERLIRRDSREEVELRASSIVAIERIRSEMEKLGRKITTNELDWILWVKAKETNFLKPHHRTITIFY